MEFLYNYLLQIIIAVHLIGFIFYMAIIKFGFKKSVTEKSIGYYVLVWFIGLLIFIVVNSNQRYDVVFILGSLVGMSLVFLIFDGILWYIGKWIYKKTSKKNNVD